MRLDIEQAIKKFNVKTFGNKSNIESMEKKLWNNEEVLYISPTNAIIYTINTKKKEKLPGVFALTSQRILFMYKAGFTESDLVFGLSEINSISCSGNGLTGGHIEIHTLTKSLDILVTYKKEIMQAIQNTINLAMNNYGKSRTVAPDGLVDVADQILKFKNLLDAGAITQEEFDAKKKQLLGL